MRRSETAIHSHPADWVMMFGALAKACGADADAGETYKALAAFCDAGLIL
ncbi:MAG: hypothetical protein PHI39_09965 [Kiritimatiellae bacterium]|jgi:hypothetical protein|nr:hypothetical protein [Kiritimatiellia bacterium]